MEKDSNQSEYLYFGDFAPGTEADTAAKGAVWRMLEKAFVLGKSLRIEVIGVCAPYIFIEMELPAGDENFCAWP